MLIVMKKEAREADIERVCSRIRDLGFEPRPMPGGQVTAVGLVGNDGPVDPAPFAGLPGVGEVIRVSAPYKLVSRQFKPTSTVVRLANGVEIGGGAVCLMGGPCSVESEAQVFDTAAYVAAAGVRVLRGGAFKPRTSPYGFQGLGEPGLKLLAAAARAHGMACVTEAMDPAGADLVAEHADIIQIGARNMQNFALLKHVGRLDRPVLLKRGMSATIKEWLLAAEYVLNEGNEQVILCERGIRSYDDTTRNVMDVAAIPVARDLSHLPVIADPSHATGVRDKVIPMARAAVAAGADGLIVETHPCPEEALSDGAQSLYPEQFAQLVREVRAVAEAVGARVGLEKVA